MSVPAAVSRRNPKIAQHKGKGKEPGVGHVYRQMKGRGNPPADHEPRLPNRKKNPGVGPVPRKRNRKGDHFANRAGRGMKPPLKKPPLKPTLKKPPPPGDWERLVVLKHLLIQSKTLLVVPMPWEKQHRSRRIGVRCRMAGTGSTPTSSKSAIPVRSGNRV